VSRQDDRPEADDESGSSPGKDDGGDERGGGTVAPGGTGSSGLQDSDFEREEPEGA